MRVTSPHFLAAKAAGVAAIQSVNFALTNGDADSDNQIIRFYYVTIDWHFGAQGE